MGGLFKSGSLPVGYWKKQVFKPKCSRSAVERYNSIDVVKFFPNPPKPQFERMKLLGYFLIAELFCLPLNTSGHVALFSQLAAPVGAAAKAPGLQGWGAGTRRSSRATSKKFEFSASFPPKLH